MHLTHEISNNYKPKIERKMEKIAPFKIDLADIKKKVDMGLDVETNALLCPNPEEWYAKAYIRNNYDNFRVIPRVKEGTKVATNLFPATTVLKEFDCDFTALDSSLDAVSIETTPYSVMFEICQRDLEESFVSLNMAAGNENWKNATMFFSHYWDVLAMKVAQDISIAKWRGQVAGGVSNAVITGLQGRITASADTVDVGTAVTDFTDVTAIEGVFEEIVTDANVPESLYEEGVRSELRFYVNPRVLMAIQIAQAKNNTTNYTVTPLGAFYMGIPIIADGGVEVGFIVMTRRSNLIVAVDAVADENNLKVRDLDVINVPKIRTRIDGKLGTQIVNDEEIIYAVEA